MKRRLWFWSGVLLLASSVLVGCTTRGPVPEVPLVTAQTDVSQLRILVTKAEVAHKDSGADDFEALSQKNAFAQEWFEDFTKAFRAAALDAGFRVVESGEHDVEVILSGSDLDVRKDVIDKTATVRAKVVTGGKSKELLGELIYHLTEADFEEPGTHKRWMEKLNSQSFYAHKLMNQVLAEPRLADVSGSAGGTTTVAKGDGPKPGGIVTGAPQRDAYALIVGVEKYRDVKSPATGAERDAKLFAEVATKTMGIPSEHVRVAVGDRATKGDIEKHVDWIVANVPQGGRIYLYFSGHGAPDGAQGTPYLLPYDGDPAALDRTALPLQQLLERLEASKAKEAVAFVDTCFSGAGGRSVLPEGARPLVRVKKTTAPARVALLSASSGEQISGPSADKKNGVFTQFVAQGIGNAEADADGDGVVTLAELATWVKPRVEREARKQGRDQTPELSTPAGGSADDVVVAHGVK
ncbi:MAG: caspase family protein [Myxococcales bacterium]|nr:caspase family protein [Myxococcales bacterium]